MFTESVTSHSSPASSPQYPSSPAATDVTPTLILDTKRSHEDDNMMMLVAGAKEESHVMRVGGQIIGRTRRRKHEESCNGLESWVPSFTGYTGTTYLASIQALVVCGYNLDMARVSHQKCWIHYRHGDGWQPLQQLWQDMAIYDGAFLPWHNKLVVLGGYQKAGGSTSVSKSMMVIEFSPVTDIFGSTHHDDEEGSGDDEEYAYHDDDDEGSGGEDLAQEHAVKFVDDGLTQTLETYGPGIAQGCAVTLAQTRNNVVFIITGGENDMRQTMSKAWKMEIVSRHGSYFPGMLREILPEMRVARRQHGCYKVKQKLF